MREAFGGVFMMKLLLIILFVVVAFAAVGLSIAKGYRVKNQLISYIEQYEGCLLPGDYVDGQTMEKCTLRGDNEDKINNYLRKIGYDPDNYIYLVERNRSSSDNGYYYTVYVQVNWNLPFVSSKNTSINNTTFSNGSGGSWTISGKTELIRE